MSHAIVGKVRNIIFVWLQFTFVGTSRTWLREKNMYTQKKNPAMYFKVNRLTRLPWFNLSGVYFAVYFENKAVRCLRTCSMELHAF